MKTRMIIINVMIGILVMIPKITQAQPQDAVVAVQQQIRERCPSLLNLVPITGQVVEIYMPKVMSTSEMEVRFRLSDPNSEYNCVGFLFKSNPEEVKAVYAALLTALNSCKLNITFCCSLGKKLKPTIETPIGFETKPEWKEWRDIYSLSIKIE